LIDEIVRDGARRMLAVALQAEVAAYIAAHAGAVDADGHRLVVRNGHHEPRKVVTAAGAVPVRAPRGNDKRADEATGQRQRFSSAKLPAWSRRSPRVAEVLPLLYLHGLSSQDFGPALEQFLGSGAGLSAGTITRLTAQWQDKVRAFGGRSLAGTDYVYVWVDGIHLKVRLEQDKVCLLVMIGVRADGTKELIALDDGHRESTESWADLLRGYKRRGMAAPVLAVGDGALGFWAAVRQAFPETREQRCWFHKIANVHARDRPALGDHHRLVGRHRGPHRHRRHQRPHRSREHRHQADQAHRPRLPQPGQLPRSYPARQRRPDGSVNASLQRNRSPGTSKSRQSPLGHAAANPRHRRTSHDRMRHERLPRAASGPGLRGGRRRRSRVDDRIRSARDTGGPESRL
jgi:hypothetical protein